MDSFFFTYTHILGTCVSTNGLGLLVPEASLNGYDALAASQLLAGFPGKVCQSVPYRGSSPFFCGVPERP